jgi:hypothetical protein
LIQIVVWPTVVVILAIVFRKELPKLVRALSARVSRFSFVGVTVELALAHFFGLASPRSVTRALEKRYVWLREAMVGTQLQPLISAMGVWDNNSQMMRLQLAAQEPWASLTSKETKAALNYLTEASKTGKLNLQEGEALAEIVQSVSLIDLSQTEKVGTLIDRFLGKLSRLPKTQARRAIRSTIIGSSLMSNN